MKKEIKINFLNWWGFGIDEWKSMFWFLYDYDFVLSDNPDFIVFSNTSSRSMPKIESTSNIQRIFFMGEIIDVDMSMCEWAFGDNYVDSERHFRMPYYVIRMLYTNTPFNRLIKCIDPEKILSEKTGFCNFLFSNTADGGTRNAFFKKLSKYKKVDSAGESLNNMGYILPGRSGTRIGNYIYYPEKEEFLKKYKFTIAYENNRSDYNPLSGYTTEKITEPMLANSIPIYRGNQFIDRDFNTKSFISFHDFEDEEEMIECIISLDRNDGLYIKKMSEPWLNENKLSGCLDIYEITKQFEKIFK